MNKDIKYNEDETIREIIKEAKITSSDNLKYRIMHQIETEELLKPKTTAKQNKSLKDSSNVLKDFIYIFGGMYIILAIITVVFYLREGSEFLNSPQFLCSIIFVASISSILWLLSRLDARKKNRQIGKTNRYNNSTNNDIESDK